MTPNLTTSGRLQVPSSAVEHRADASLTAPFLLVLFFASILPPIYFSIGETRLSLVRIYLLVAFLPLLFQLLGGRAGRLLAIDYLVICYSLWIAVTLLYNEGPSRIPLIGITIVEQLGGYLVGRMLVRNAADYRRMIRVFFLCLLILSPFALIELLTAHNLLADIFKPIFPTFPRPSSAYQRLGMNRVMSSFEHPILFGVFCSLGIANFFYVYQERLFKALFMLCFAVGMTFMSLSSAPLIAVSSQVFLILWDKITKGKWVLLTVLTVIAYVTVDALSNRTPVTILIGTLTFNPLSAWVRVSIFDYGYASVMRHPIWGIGLGDWPRPFWLTSSVDNFWLLTAMRHGIPAFLFLVAGLVLAMRAIIRTKGLSAEIARYRNGYLLALMGLFFSLATVTIWGGTSSFVFFYMGAGLWICSAGGAQAADAASDATTRPQRPEFRAKRAGQPVANSVASPSPNPSPKASRSGDLPRSRFAHVHRREPPPE